MCAGFVSRPLNLTHALDPVCCIANLADIFRYVGAGGHELLDRGASPVFCFFGRRISAPTKPAMTVHKLVIAAMFTIGNGIKSFGLDP